MSTKKKDRIPHVKRDVSDRHPHHVVISFRRGVPQPHWREVRAMFFRWIREVSERYGASVSLAVAMPGHAHLLVETRPGGAGLGRVMQFLKSKLALEVNRSFGRKGPLYSDRFFSRVLRTVSELVRSIRYVAMNPVEAKLCRRAEDWFGSAVRDYHQNNLKNSFWKMRSWMYRKLGFFDDPRRALEDILTGRRQAIVARGGRQQKLPFVKGLPAL